MKFQQKDTFKQYNYLEEMLNHIREVVSNDINGEIFEDSYKASLKEFCKALQLKSL